MRCGAAWWTQSAETSVSQDSDIVSRGISPHIYQPAGRCKLQRLALILCGLCGLILVLSPTTSPVANADGGAPNLAYVVSGGAGANELDVINVSQRQVAWRLALGGRPHSVLLSADGREAYVTETAANRLAIVDARGQQVSATVSVGPQPTALALDLSSNPTVLYVTEQGGNAVAVVDPSARRVVATIPVGMHPSGVAIAGSSSGISNPDDGEVYVANTDSDTVSVIATKERHVIATIPVAGGPLGVVVPATGGVAYVTTRAGDVVALNLATHRVLGTILRTAGDALGTMDYDAVTGQIYLPDATANAVDVLAPVAAGSEDANGSTIATLTIPHEPARTLSPFAEPAAVAITFDGAYGFIAERGSGQVAMMDAASHHLLAVIAVGGTPQSVITGPNPPLVSHQTAFILDMLVLALILAMPIFLFVSERRYRRKKARASAQPASAQQPGQ
jgi:YVTN family beta-propeller protein